MLKKYEKEECLMSKKMQKRNRMRNLERKSDKIKYT